MKNYLESTIPMQVGKIMSNRNYAWNDFCTESCIKTIFEGMAVFLGKKKSKDTPVALEVRDINDKFRFGAFVQYHKQDEESADEGSWTLNYTFDEDEIDRKNWKVSSFPEDQVASGIIEDIAYTQWGMIFKFLPKDNNNNVCEGSPQELICTVLDVIYDYMRTNVTTDPVLEFTNYFTATAALNGESVYVGIEPSALLKQHVKDDSGIDANKIETGNIPTRKDTAAA